MTSYQVEFSTVAAKQIARLDRPIQRRIFAKTDTLGADPRPAGSTKLVGSDSWRVRVGDYRIIYVIDDAVQIVSITRVAHRRDVYERM